MQDLQPKYSLKLILKLKTRLQKFYRKVEKINFITELRKLIAWNHENFGKKKLRNLKERKIYIVKSDGSPVKTITPPVRARQVVWTE